MVADLIDFLKVSAKINKCHKNIRYFPARQWLRKPYIEIYIDLLSINFNLLFALLHYAYRQISDYEIYTALTTIW